jgi:type 2A phosphatase activator TIP41
MDFLQDWSMAHQHIPLPGYVAKATPDTVNDINTNKDDDDNNNDNEDNITTPSYRGVQVLQTSDASLWKQKTKNIGSTSPGTPSPDTIRSTTFHYDWTYSSPYTGTFHGDSNGDDDKDTQKEDAGSHWTHLPTSGMPMHLLTDQTIPILLFDQLVFVEDDLHDNGQMQYTIKVRVMPQCAYILCQLFVRVDHVLIRVRETRWLIEFNNNNDQDNSSPPIIHRNVTWRECRWEDLTLHGLPNHVQAWTQNEAYAPPEAMAALAKLIQQLPMVPLPEDIPPFAQIILE